MILFRKNVGTAAVGPLQYVQPQRNRRCSQRRGMVWRIWGLSVCPCHGGCVREVNSPLMKFTDGV